ncbi:MAG: hypothetical protein ACI89L_001018 [Phycisphaerales bacterium]|jgi:hypothetical protein
MRADTPVLNPDSTPLGRLTEAIERVQGGPTGQDTERHRLGTGWDAADEASGGLRLGAVHEWLVESPQGQPDAAPLGIFAHLAAQHLASDNPSLVLWIGQACHPYPRSLPPVVLACSVFVTATTRTERVWATDTALRSRGAGVVIADASGFDMSASRRLQLAAGLSGGLGLLARPWSERGEISAAWTRWRVSPAMSDSDSPRWAIELLRCKRMQPTGEGTRRWCVQRDDETGDVGVVSQFGDRRVAPPRPATLATA